MTKHSRKHRLSTAALLSLFSFWLTGNALADTLCVKANDTDCYSTIQAAVTAATGDDTIELKSGVYFETVNIPIGKRGLKIEGKRSAILDGGDDGSASPATGHVMQIRSRDVHLEGFTLRGGEGAQIFLAGGVTGTHLEDLKSLGAGTGFLLSAAANHNTRVEDCVVMYNQSEEAVLIRGHSAHIEDNEFTGAADGGVHVDGNDAVVEDNEFTNIEDNVAIWIEGHSAEVVKNDIVSTRRALFVEGDNAFVSKNDIDAGYDGLLVIGANPVVEKNELRGLSGGSYNALVVECYGACDQGRVYKNEVDEGGGGVGGVEVYSDSGGLEVEKNEVDDVSWDGLSAYLNGGGRVIKNDVKTAGQPGSSCIVIDGDQVEAEDNEASACGGHGYEIRGDEHNIEDNRVTGARTYGYAMVWGNAGLRLEDNSSKDAAFAGFLLDDASTASVLVDNSASGNRFDLCDRGDATDATDNDFDADRVLNFGAPSTEECPIF